MTFYGILSGILAGILSDVPIWQAIWRLTWNSATLPANIWHLSVGFLAPRELGSSPFCWASGWAQLVARRTGEAEHGNRLPPNPDLSSSLPHVLMKIAINSGNSPIFRQAEIYFHDQFYSQYKSQDFLVQSVKNQWNPAIFKDLQPRGNSTPRKDQRRSREAGTNCCECDSLGGLWHHL